LGKSVSEEGSWVEGYSLLNNKEVKVRFLFSAEENDLKLYRMDVRELNKDNDNNKINNVILNNDIIMVWTNLEEEIIKISLRHNGANYVIKLNEE
jgi:hemin uptake protein HemP